MKRQRGGTRKRRSTTTAAKRRGRTASSSGGGAIKYGSSGAEALRNATFFGNRSKEESARGDHMGSHIYASIAAGAKVAFNDPRRSKRSTWPTYPRHDKRAWPDPASGFRPTRREIGF